MREPYQGVLQILRFNRRFYAGTLASVVIAWIIAAYFPTSWRAVTIASTLPAFLWMCSSLAVSHYVYDRFPLYDFRWLARALSRSPKRWVNIHAGLDETSHLLADLFPSGQGQILDIYDPREMTEHSIEEARSLNPHSAATAAHWDSLPIPDDALDAAFLIFAAHELRSRDSRVRLFRELARTLRRGGEVALIEHSRDWRNFLAFGPGFLHFFSTRTWRETANAAGLSVRTELFLTPFVRAYLLRRAA